MSAWWRAPRGNVCAAGNETRVPRSVWGGRTVLFLGVIMLLLGAVLLPAVGLDLRFGPRAVTPESVAFPLFLEVGPDEPVASLQADIRYTADSLEFFQAFPGAAASASGKDVAAAVLGDSELRIIVAGFNQTLVPGGVVAELYFLPVGDTGNSSVQIVGAVFSGPSGENVPPTTPPVEGENPATEGEEAPTTPPENPPVPNAPPQEEGEKETPTTNPPTTSSGENLNYSGGGFPAGFGNDSGNFGGGGNKISGKANGARGQHATRRGGTPIPGAGQPRGVYGTSGNATRPYPEQAPINPARPNVATPRPPSRPGQPLSATGIAGANPNAERPTIPSSGEDRPFDGEFENSKLSLLAPVARSPLRANTEPDAATGGYLQQARRSSILPIIGAGVLLVLLGGLLAFRHHFRRILKL